MARRGLPPRPNRHRPRSTRLPLPPQTPTSQQVATHHDQRSTTHHPTTRNRPDTNTQTLHPTTRRTHTYPSRRLMNGRHMNRRELTAEFWRAAKSMTRLVANDLVERVNDSFTVKRADEVGHQPHRQSEISRSAGCFPLFAGNNTQDWLSPRAIPLSRVHPRSCRESRRAEGGRLEWHGGAGPPSCRRRCPERDTSHGCA
jgi:hypothetical protein